MTASDTTPSLQYWRFQMSFWSICWVMNVVFSRAWGYGSLFYDILFIAVSFIMFAVTHGYRWLYVRHGQQKSIAGICLHLLWLLPLSAALIQASIALIALVYLTHFTAYTPGYQQLSGASAIIGYIMNITIILVVWCLICLLRIEWIHRSNTERDYWQNQLRLREVELQFLRRQINSHFLFNALNNIRALIREDPDAARQAVADLATLLRGVMHGETRGTISLRDEIELVKGYLALEALQFEQRLSFELHIDPHLQEAQLPPLLLQTLVENAIKHGIARRAKGGAIRISATMLSGQRWCLQVENPPAELPANRESNGIGLKNARSRLYSAFGDLASLELAQAATVLARAEMPMGITAA